MASMSATRFSQRHEPLAIVFLRPRPLTSCVERDDYFPRQRLGQQGAAIERCNEIGDIIALTANQACVGHGDRPVIPESPSSTQCLRLRHPA